MNDKFSIVVGDGQLADDDTQLTLALKALNQIVRRAPLISADIEGVYAEFREKAVDAARIAIQKGELNSAMVPLKDVLPVLVASEAMSSANSESSKLRKDIVEIARLLPGVEPESFECLPLASIRFREEKECSWQCLELAEFEKLSEERQCRILLSKERTFSDGEGRAVPAYRALPLLLEKLRPEGHETAGARAEMNVLIVDDEPFMREAISLKLRKRFTQEVSVVTAEGVDECWKILRGTHESKTIEKPYVLFLDVIMPGKSGLDLLAEIREDEKLRDTVVFMVSSVKDVEAKRRADELKCAGFIVKHSL